jgi:hypothetical protein
MFVEYGDISHERLPSLLTGFIPVSRLEGFEYLGNGFGLGETSPSKMLHGVVASSDDLDESFRQVWTRSSNLGSDSLGASSR